MATSRSRSVPDSYNFTVVYDGCLSWDDKTDSTKLSYEFVKLLQEKARKQGIICFLPHLMLNAGEMEKREIYSAVENSDHVILVMTEGYLRKMGGKKSLDSQYDPDLMLQQIHYNIIDYKISENADGIIVVPIYLQTRKKEISLGAYRSIQFRKKEDWDDEENWEKIWNLITKGLEASVLTGSAVSSQGSSGPEAGESAQNDSNQGVRSQEPAAAAVSATATETAENPQDSMQFESLTSDARVSSEETAGSSTADSKTDAQQRSDSTEDDSTASRDHHPGSPPCVNMDSSPSGARNLQPSALTGSAVSSQGSSEPDAGESDLQPSVLTGSAVSSRGSSVPDAGESAQNDSNQGVRSQETAAAVSETASDAVPSMTENFSKMSSSKTTGNPQDSMQVESLTSDARLSAEAGSSTADSKTDVHRRSESTEDDSTSSCVHNAGSPPCVNMDSSPSGAMSLQPLVLTGSAVSSGGSSVPDAGKSGLEASSVLTGSAVSSQGSSEPDAGESAQSGVRSQETAAAVSETATDAVPSMTENFSKMSSSETTENPQDSMQVESLILGTKSSDEKTENEGAASGISRSQSEPACSQQQQEKKSLKEKISDWFSKRFSKKQ